MIVLKQPHLATHVSIWSPKYSSEGGWTVLLSKSKVHHASSVIIVDFTKAKHLQGQRFAISREKAEHAPETTNGKIACYNVPFDDLEPWMSAEEDADEIRDTIEKLGWWRPLEKPESEHAR